MNIAKALASEGAREYATLCEKERRLMSDIMQVRMEKHLLEDAAMVYAVNLNEASTEQT